MDDIISLENKNITDQILKTNTAISKVDVLFLAICE